MTRPPAIWYVGEAYGDNSGDSPANAAPSVGAIAGYRAGDTVLSVEYNPPVWPWILFVLVLAGICVLILLAGCSVGHEVTSGPPPFPLAGHEVTSGNPVRVVTNVIFRTITNDFTLTVIISNTVSRSLISTSTVPRWQARPDLSNVGWFVYNLTPAEANFKACTGRRRWALRAPGLFGPWTPVQIAETNQVFILGTNFWRLQWL